MVRKSIGCCIATLVIMTQAGAAPFTDITNSFNVLTFGDFTSKNEQTWGSLGASGDVNIEGSYAVGTQWAGSGDYSKNVVVSGGEVKLSGDGTVWGSVSAAGKVTVSSNQTVVGDINAPVADINTVFNFGQAKTQLDSYSSYLASQTAIEGVVSPWTNIKFTGAMGVDINYFTIDASDLENLSEIMFENISHGSKAVITVTGEDVCFIPQWGGNPSIGSNFGILGLGSDGGKPYASNILWNFVDAKKLKVGGSIGTILATNATTTLVGGEIWGDLITGSISGQSQMHVAHWGGDVPTTNVPEPSSIVMIFLGAISLLTVSRNKITLKK